MNEKSKATAISSIFFYISTNTTISPGGERRLIVSVCFSMYIEARRKKEILCQLDKHTHHLVTKLSKKKELAFHSFFFVQDKYTRTSLLSLMLVVGCRIDHFDCLYYC
jgi:hypothetical protein